MNNYDKNNSFDVIRSLLASQMHKAAKELVKEITSDKSKLRRFLEYRCETVVTDEDMLKIHIDIALENNDKEMFMKLTNQLNEVAQVK